MNQAQARKILKEIRDAAREDLKQAARRKDSAPSFYNTAKLVEKYGYLDGRGAAEVEKGLAEAANIFEGLGKSILSAAGYSTRIKKEDKELFVITLLALKTTDIDIELKMESLEGSTSKTQSGQRIELKTPKSLIRASSLGKDFLTEFRARAKGTKYFKSEQIFKATIYSIEMIIEEGDLKTSNDTSEKIKLAKWVQENATNEWFVFRFPTLAGELAFSVAVEKERFIEFVTTFPDFFKVTTMKNNQSVYLMFDPFDPQKLWDAGTLDQPFTIHYHRAAKFYQYRGFLNKTDTELLAKKNHYPDYYNQSGWTADDIIKYNAFVSGEYKDKFEDIHFSMFGSIKYK